MKVAESVLDLIGETPLLRIRKVNENENVKLYAKLEGFNIGGSVKDRICHYMIMGAEREGKLTKKKTILIEPTSGNTGIGLALVAAVKGYKVKLIMPETMSVERRKILKAYGAELILTPVEEGMNPQKAMDVAIDVAKEITNKNNIYFMPDQFSNKYNVLAHYKTTGPEIWKQTKGEITHFVAGMGTGGTLMGAGRYLKEKNPKIKIIGVEPDEKTPIQGLKNMSISYKPEILDLSKLDEKINVTIEQAFETARIVARKEGLLVGISGGAALHVALKKARELDEGFITVVIPDDGMKYLSTPLYE